MPTSAPTCHPTSPAETPRRPYSNHADMHTSGRARLPTIHVHRTSPSRARTRLRPPVRRPRHPTRYGPSHLTIRRTTTRPPLRGSAPRLKPPSPTMRRAPAHGRPTPIDPYRSSDLLSPPPWPQSPTENSSATHSLPPCIPSSPNPPPVHAHASGRPPPTSIPSPIPFPFVDGELHTSTRRSPVHHAIYCQSSVLRPNPPASPPSALPLTSPISNTHPPSGECTPPFGRAAYCLHVLLTPIRTDARRASPTSPFRLPVYHRSIFPSTTAQLRHVALFLLYLMFVPSANGAPLRATRSRALPSRSPPPFDVVWRENYWVVLLGRYWLLWLV